MKQDEYYESIRNKIIDNEVTKRVKDYSKRLSDLDTYLWQKLIRLTIKYKNF